MPTQLLQLQGSYSSDFKKITPAPFLITISCTLNPFGENMVLNNYVDHNPRKQKEIF